MIKVLKLFKTKLLFAFMLVLMAGILLESTNVYAAINNDGRECPDELYKVASTMNAHDAADSTICYLNTNDWNIIDVNKNVAYVYLYPETDISKIEFLASRKTKIYIYKYSKNHALLSKKDLVISSKKPKYNDTYELNEKQKLKKNQEYVIKIKMSSLLKKDIKEVLDLKLS